VSYFGESESLYTELLYSISRSYRIKLSSVKINSENDSAQQPLQPDVYWIIIRLRDFIILQGPKVLTAKRKALQINMAADITNTSRRVHVLTRILQPIHRQRNVSTHHFTLTEWFRFLHSTKWNLTQGNSRDYDKCTWLWVYGTESNTRYRLRDIKCVVANRWRELVSNSVWINGNCHCHVLLKVLRVYEFTVFFFIAVGTSVA